MLVIGYISAAPLFVLLGLLNVVYIVAPVLLVLGLVGYLMKATNPKFSEWAKQIAVWLGITSLLPLVAWFGTAAFYPPPDSEEFNRVQSRLNERLGSATTQTDKDALRAEIDQRAKQNTDAEHKFERRMFWVAWPVGILALVIGTFVSVQTVGAGLMFGGTVSYTH